MFKYVAKIIQIKYGIRIIPAIFEALKNSNIVKNTKISSRITISKAHEIFFNPKNTGLHKIFNNICIIKNI